MIKPNIVPTPASAESNRHPPGLKVIFFTEMWERFSYYGMRALLVLYLVKALGYPRSDALELYGTYTGLVYLTLIVLLAPMFSAAWTKLGVSKYSLSNLPA